MKPESAYLLEFLLENFSANRGDRNLQVSDEILVTKPNHIEVLLVRGLLLSESEKHLEAIQSYTQAIEIASGMDLANAYAGRCFNYYQLEEFQKSLDDCEYALGLNPNESVLWITKGMLLLYLHDDPSVASLQAFQKGLEINPHDQKMLELKEMMTGFIKEKLEKRDVYSFQETIEFFIDNIRLKSSTDSDEIDRSYERLKDLLTTFQEFSDRIEDQFKKIPFLFLEDNKYLLIYYLSQATNLGMNAIHPSFDREKMEHCQDFLKKAKQLIENNKDYERIDDIQILLEKGFSYAEDKATSSFKIGNISMTVLAAGAFSLVLLLSGQWFVGLIGLGITYWLWQT